MEVIYVEGYNKSDGTIAAICSNCNNSLEDISDSWKFCPYCGEKIEDSKNVTISEFMNEQPYE